MYGSGLEGPIDELAVTMETALTGIVQASECAKKICVSDFMSEFASPPKFATKYRSPAQCDTLRPPFSRIVCYCSVSPPSPCRAVAAAVAQMRGCTDVGAVDSATTEGAAGATARPDRHCKLSWLNRQ